MTPVPSLFTVRNGHVNEFLPVEHGWKSCFPCTGLALENTATYSIRLFPFTTERNKPKQAEEGRGHCFRERISMKIMTGFHELGPAIQSIATNS